MHSQVNYIAQNLSLSLCLSVSHKHPHTHTQYYDNDPSKLSKLERSERKVSNVDSFMLMASELGPAPII